MVQILQTISPSQIVGFLIKHWAVITIGCASVIAVGILGLLLWKIKSRKSNSKPASKAKSRPDADACEQMADSDYQLISQRVLGTNGKYKSLLFAAAGLNCLPITIPVNVAIDLAEQKKRCLLIDLDLKRDAVATVFNLSDKTNPKNLRPRPYKTPFENLQIWPGRNFNMTKQMNIKHLVEAAIEKFDLVLINAPYLDSSPDRTQVALAAQCSIIFTQNTAQATRLASLMQASGCKLIGNIQITPPKA
ncbi:MAG: hypothetical protein ACYTFK_11300 [Planctomycetota bacterium]|jgi:hypothetical protein